MIPIQIILVRTQRTYIPTRREVEEMETDSHLSKMDALANAENEAEELAAQHYAEALTLADKCRKEHGNAGYNAVFFKYMNKLISAMP